MPAITSAASAICGTHLGETNAVASMAGKPASESRSISAILVSVGTVAFSFCSPSRGPTSTNRTRRGSFVVVATNGVISSVTVIPVDHAADGLAMLDSPDLGGHLRDRFRDQRHGGDVRRDRDSRMMPE